MLHLTYFMKYYFDFSAGSIMTRKELTEEEIHALNIASDVENELQDYNSGSEFH